MESLAGHVLVVTDGGSEPGALIARRIARAGATVVLYDEDAARADQAAADIRHAWGITAVQIGNPFAKKQTALIEDVVRTCSGLDGLILLERNGTFATGLVDAAMAHLAARDRGLIVVVGLTAAKPRIGPIEEGLGVCRRALDRDVAASVRTCGVCGLDVGIDLGPAIEHLAITRPDEDTDGRVVVVPPA